MGYGHTKGSESRWEAIWDTSSALRVVTLRAPADPPFCAELRNHLSGLEQSGKVVVWHPGLVPPGKNADVERTARLNGADVVVALLSAEAWPIGLDQTATTSDASIFGVRVRPTRQSWTDVTARFDPAWLDRLHIPPSRG